MQYLAGLIVFSGIGSFLISDAIDFWKEFVSGHHRSPLFLDFFRLLALGAMTGVGYLVAAETFQKPRDWAVFLAIGTLGAASIYAFLSVNRHARRTRN